MTHYDLDLIWRTMMLRGWSINRLATVAGCSARTLYEARDGKRTLRGRTVLKLCKALRLSVARVVTQSGVV